MTKHFDNLSTPPCRPPAGRDIWTQTDNTSCLAPLQVCVDYILGVFHFRSRSIREMDVKMLFQKRTQAGYYSMEDDSESELDPDVAIHPSSAPVPQQVETPLRTWAVRFLNGHGDEPRVVTSPMPVVTSPLLATAAQPPPEEISGVGTCSQSIDPLPSFGSIRLVEGTPGVAARGHPAPCSTRAMLLQARSSAQQDKLSYICDLHRNCNNCREFCSSTNGACVCPKEDSCPLCGEQNICDPWLCEVGRLRDPESCSRLRADLQLRDNDRLHSRNNPDLWRYYLGSNEDCG
jgi:hypothetical protein